MFLHGLYQVSFDGLVLCRRNETFLETNTDNIKFWHNLEKYNHKEIGPEVINHDNDNNLKKFVVQKSNLMIIWNNALES